MNERRRRVDDVTVPFTRGHYSSTTHHNEPLVSDSAKRTT